MGYPCRCEFIRTYKRAELGFCGQAKCHLKIAKIIQLFSTADDLT